jgi:hypothetical protein
MTSHHEEPPVHVEEVPAEEEMPTADAADELEESPEEKSNYTDKHPERFRAPATNEREARGR